ncbi:MAG: PAS-domain containing protein [Alphaproteobacteria bacterium]|nr:PAS-domain containing protein [Alphaproteobacteria bacterium]
MNNFFGLFTGAHQLEVEKSRLEAFLSAFPGKYCGFSPDGSVIYSPNFPQILGISKIETIHDIQNALEVSDAAILEGHFIALQEKGKAFSFNSRNTAKDQTFRLSGSKGEALNGQEHFLIIWLEDITSDQEEQKSLRQAHQRQEHEVQKLQMMLNALPMPLWMRDQATQIIWCNQAYAQIVNDTVENVLTKQQEITLSTKDPNVIQAPKMMARQVLDTGEPQTNKAHIITGGKRYFVEISELLLPDKGHTLGMLRDITGEERRDSELKRYHSANTTLLEQLRSAIAIFGAEHQLEFYNSAFSSLWGLEDQWLNGAPKLGDILEKLRETRRLPEQADFRSYKKNWLDMFTSLIDPHEDMMYLPDGSAVRFSVIPHPMGGLMMIFEDVTSRLELESSYNTLIAVQKETLDNLAEGVAVYGGDGRLKLSNPAYSTLWGLHPEDIEGEPHITALVNKMSALFEEPEWPKVKEVLISHAIERDVQEGHLKRTDEKLIEFAKVPLPDGGVLLTYFDVTDEMKVQKALQEKNIALEEADKIKTGFLANVSYQLRTPLNAIMGFAEILDNQYFGQLNDKQKEYSEGIRDAGDKLVHLIDDILDLSTIEAGYLDLTFGSFDLHKMLQSIHEITSQWAQKENLSLSLDCPKNIGELHADERRIKQVMLNLIHNAINFTPEKGKIIISASRKLEENIIEISVSDTGIGISKIDQERIFEPFSRALIEHRADMSPQTLSRGAGLGLSLVKNITELHGGSVLIDSEPDKGTKVTLQLPISGPPEDL